MRAVVVIVDNLGAGLAGVVLESKPGGDRQNVDKGKHVYIASGANQMGQVQHPVGTALCRRAANDGASKPGTTGGRPGHEPSRAPHDDVPVLDPRLHLFRREAAYIKERRHGIARHRPQNPSQRHPAHRRDPQEQRCQRSN